MFFSCILKTDLQFKTIVGQRVHWAPWSLESRLIIFFCGTFSTVTPHLHHILWGNEIVYSLKYRGINTDQRTEEVSQWLVRLAGVSSILVWVLLTSTWQTGPLLTLKIWQTYIRSSSSEGWQNVLEHRGQPSCQGFTLMISFTLCICAQAIRLLWGHMMRLLTL